MGTYVTGQRATRRAERRAMDKPKVVLGVSGGIAAYKACELLRRLTESGHEVRVVP
ncbi:flavoprotein, partial [Streptomyces sp. 2MCAF27]